MIFSSATQSWKILNKVGVHGWVNGSGMERWGLLVSCGRSFEYGEEAQQGGETLLLEIPNMGPLPPGRHYFGSFDFPNLKSS